MDSTIIQLPEKLKSTYSGNGVGASNSSAKLKVEYDLLTGNFNNIGFSSGSKSDSDCIYDVIHDIEENYLCIRDLGYFSLRVFKQLNDKGSYYISKIKSSLCLNFEKSGNIINIP